MHASFVAAATANRQPRQRYTTSSRRFAKGIHEKIVAAGKRPDALVLVTMAWASSVGGYSMLNVIPLGYSQIDGR
ncbi:hypothetical protein J2Z31_005388 [Sinorhizobium kostiense]|uniref:Uncharacterized protein n=1 Tax=Sinorhizobium kostiense TaxID=76747 RepID=A0ABS4RAI9_9HYPH|nr:hypothetical protein [Sinorhizobium kostiense]MBP2238847.1 hypothetical protein [Sinorhizobium kostiense]